MLESGIDSKHLRMLAAFEPKDSNFEAQERFAYCARELSLPDLTKSDAVRGYAKYLAMQIINGQSPPREGVRKLCVLCYENDYPKYLMPFYNLDDARADVDGGYEPFSWPSATHANLDDLVLAEARTFLQGES